MRVAVTLVLIGVAGCGRLGFAEQDVRSDGSPDGDGDAASTVGRCGDPLAVASTVHVTGTTFTYGSMPDAIFAVGSAVVTIRDRTSNATIATATSDETSGEYDVSAALDHPLDATLVYSRADLFVTSVFLDRPLARDIVGMTSKWEPGDGSMWTSVGMATVYSNDGVVRDPDKGTITFHVRDCQGTPIAGATLNVSPEPERLSYQTASGPGSETEATYGFALALNANPGATHVDVMAQGFNFDPIDISVTAGSASDVVVVRGY